MIYTRGNRNGILIVGDSLPPNKNTIQKISQVLDPTHPVYNSLIIPIKYYINNYLISKDFQLPLEKPNVDFFFYINAIDDPSTKSNPDLNVLNREVNRTEHKIILPMGSFAFWSVENVLERVTKKNCTIEELGRIFYQRISITPIDFPIVLPILHNVANLKFEETKKFIMDQSKEYISYYHYVGFQIGKLLLSNKDNFALILNRSA